MPKTAEELRQLIGLHLGISAMLGTARHLREKHGVPESEIDTEDKHGLGHDHALLHGLKVNERGQVYTGPAPDLNLHHKGA